MRKIKAALIGAGDRGFIYANYALTYKAEVQFVAVAEPQEHRREKFKKLHCIKDDMCFSTWEDMMRRGKIADAVVICTMDQLHYGPALQAMELGYHILLEKPMASDINKCVMLGEYSKKYPNLNFSICHILRYTRFFSKIKSLIDADLIGGIMSINHNEFVSYPHYALSFVTGRWRNSKESTPMIVQKCCHDMDIISWLMPSKCKKISSFGSLSYFKKENVPEGAPERCTDGCSHENDCSFFAPRMYAGNSGKLYMHLAETEEIKKDDVLEILKTSPHGRCVFKCDNDVVDHQVVNMEFEGGETAVLTMNAFNAGGTRELIIHGTKGELRADMTKNMIHVKDFLTFTSNTYKLTEPVSGHGGGDEAIMQDFVKNLGGGESEKSKTSAKISVQSHLMAFAAEKSRLEGRVIDIEEYLEDINRELGLK